MSRLHGGDELNPLKSRLFHGVSLFPKNMFLIGNDSFYHLSFETWLWEQWVQGGQYKTTNLDICNFPDKYFVSKLI